MKTFVTVHLLWMIVFLSCCYATDSENSVKIELSVSGSQMTLTCLIRNRNPLLNIYLECPFGRICKENCKRNCFGEMSDQRCMADKMIECKDKGFDQATELYSIEYVINGSDSRNNGQWKCSYASSSSSVVSVEAVLPKFISTIPPKEENWSKPLRITIAKTTVKDVVLIDQNQDNQTPNYFNDSLMNRSEFFLVLIGMLVVSLIFNIFFFFRMVFVRHRRRNGRDNNFMKEQMAGKWPFYSCNSQATPISSDHLTEPFRSDTGHMPFDARQMSFLTAIKMANGNYVGQSTLGLGSSGPSTLLSSKYVPTVSHSPSFPGSSSNSSRKQLINHTNHDGSTQMYLPFRSDNGRAETASAFAQKYDSTEILPENRYSSNYLKTISPELLLDRNSSRNRFDYSAFKSSPSPISNSHHGQQTSHNSPTRSPPPSSDIRPFLISSQMNNKEFVAVIPQPLQSHSYYRPGSAETMDETDDHVMNFTENEMEMIP